MSLLEQQILAPSERRPVLVDFWAPWCGPCRVIGPVLEKLAAEPDARFTLVKVNTDEHQDIAAAFRISSIPALKLFDRRKVVAELVGALPETQLRAWLARVLPSDAARAVSEARKALADGDRSRAVTALRGVVDGGASDPEARALLALTTFFDDRPTAVALASSVGEGDAGWDEAQAVRSLDTALSGPRRAPEGTSGSQLEAWQLYAAGLAALERGEIGSSLEHLIDSMRRSRKPADDGARHVCIAVFKWLGESDPLTLEHRRAFASALY